MKTRHIGFASGDLEMAGELVHPDGDARALVVLCHGIPGERDRSDSGYAGFARTMAAEGFAAFWFDFRGARSAPGDFSVGGWVADVNAALDALGRHAAGLPVVLAGSSMGGSVVVTAGSMRDDVAAVATLAAPAHFGFASADPERIVAQLRNQGIIRDPAYPKDPEAWAEEATALAPEAHVAAFAPRPLLVVHGDADEVVPYAEAERLFAAAKPVKELARIPGASHRLRHDPRAIACLTDWLDRIVSRERAHPPS